MRAGYFATLGVPVISGRAFAGDASDPTDAMVVDEAFARLLWPGDVAVGKRLKTLGAWFTVIGVVGSAHHTRLDEDPRPTFYVSQSSIAVRAMTMVARVDGDPLAHLDAFRQAVRSLDPTIAIRELEPFADRVTRSTASEAYRTTLLDLFAVLALVLTSVGVFGVTMRAVNQRRREIGIRVALGAGPASVASALLRDQIASVALGLLVGLAGAVEVAPLLRSFTFNTSATDPRLLAGATLLLLLASVCAALPAVRVAARVDPSLVMRDS